LFARSFGASYQLVGIMIGTYAFGRLLCDLPSGALVERLGAYEAGVAGAVTFGIFGILTGLAPNFVTAVVFQFGAGCGAAVLTTGLFSYCYQTMSERGEGRQLGLLFGAISIGALVGEPIGGALARAAGLPAVMYIWGGLTLGLAAVMAVALPRLPPLHAPDGVLHHVSWLSLLRKRSFRAAAAANLSTFWLTAAVYDVIVPLFVRNALNGSLFVVGLVIGIATAAETVALYPAGSIVDRMGPRALLVASLVADTIATVTIALSRSELVLGITLAATGVFAGAVVVAAAALLAERSAEQNRATAAYRFFGDAGYVIGPLMAGWTIGVLGFRWAFVVSAVPALPAIYLALRWHRDAERECLITTVGSR
jgi:MFS family permease